MEKTLFFAMILLVSVLVSTVHGRGEVILDRIVPVKSDRVTFLDPLFTNLGVLNHIVTDTFAVTRQFELNVGVPDVFLTGLGGGAVFSGSLGGLISSKNGDISLSANRTVQFLSAGINALAFGNVTFLSGKGDINFNSSYPFVVNAGSASLFSESGLNATTLGHITFTAGDYLALTSGGALNIVTDGEFSLDARHGNVVFTIGNTVDLSTTDYARIDGVHGLSIAARTDLSLIGGASVLVQSVTHDTIVRDDINFQFRNLEFYGSTGLVFGAGNINVLAATSMGLTGQSQTSEHGFEFGESLNITARGSANFNTAGASSAIEFENTGLFANITDTVSLRAGYNVVFGSNSTDIFSILSKNLFIGASHSHIRADNNVTIGAFGEASFATATTILTADRISSISESVQGITADDLIVLTRAKQAEPSSIDSNRDLIFTAGSDFTFYGFKVLAQYNGSQTYTVSELNINSGPNAEIGISAVDNLSVTTTNDITGVTRDLNYFIGGDLTFTLNDATFQADETLARNFNSSFTSSGATQISGGRLLINGGNTTITSDGSSINVGADNYHVSGDEIMFNANQAAITVDLIHIDADSHTEWNINNLDLTANNNIYIKTSVLSLANNNTFDIVASSVTGIVNQLNFNSTGDLDLDTSGRGDIVFSSGSGSITLFSNNSQTYNIGTDFQLRAQEEIGFTGGQVVGFAAVNDITMKGSQEFEFYANNSIEFTSNDSSYEADIFVARTEGNLVSTTAEADLFESGWFVVDGNDVVIFANTFVFEPSTANALELQMDSSNVAFGGSTVTYSSGDITFNAVDYRLVAASNLNFNINGESVIGSEAFIVNSRGTVNFQPLVTSAATEIYSGVDDFVVFEAATTQTFAAIDLLSITGYQSVVDFTAATAIILQSVATTTFTSVDETVISSADTLNIVAESSLTLSSFEDLSFETFNNSNIVINVAQSFITNVGRDFYIIADGLDTDVSTNCSISITSNFGDTLFNSQAGKLNLDSRDDFQIRSFLSGQPNSGAFNVNAFGNIYMESLQRALTYISDGAVTFSTTDATNNGNMEWIAADAAGLFLAENGFQLSSDDLHIEGEDGVSFIANQTAVGATNGIAWTGLNSYVSGTRGIHLFAGTDAPVVAADVAFQADNLFLEAQDRIYQRTIGALRLAAGDFTLNTFEGNAITIIAAGDYTHTAANYIVRTEDGNILVNSNSKSLRSTSVDDTIFQTNDGPIGFDAISGSFSFVAPDITVTSVKDMDLTTLGKALITAGNNLDVVGTDEGCVVFETRRTLDTITMNAATTTITVDSTDVNNEEPDIQVYGNNIDFTNPSITGFTAQDDIVIGDDSAPIVRITAANTPQNPGVTITSGTSLYMNTSNTFTSTSDTFTFNAAEDSSFVALGSITAVSQTGDVVFTANEGDVTTVAETITTTIGGADSLTGGSSVVLSSTGVDLGDRFAFTSTANVIVTAVDARLGTQNRDSSYEADIAGDFELTFGSVVISNSENFGTPTTDYPYADYNVERSEIIISNINQPATYTAASGISYTVGTDDGSDIPLYNRPTFYQTTDGDFTISTVGFTLFGSDDAGAILPNVYLGSQGTFTSTSNTGFSSTSELDTVVDSLQSTVVTAVDGATFSSGVYSVYRIDGAATETVDGDFTLTAGTGVLTDYSPYVQYKSEIGTIDVNAPDGITFTARGTIPASAESEQYFRVHAGRDLNFAATDTTFTVSGSEVEFTGGDVEINAGTSTTINAAQSTYETQGLASDIIFTGTGAFTYTGGDFVNLVGSDNVIANANSQTITAPVISYNSVSGNVADISDDITINAATSATFTSQGYLSNNNGIYIHTTLAEEANGFTLGVTDTATFAADQQQRYLSLETITLTTPTLYVETTSTNSPILIDSRLGALSVVSTTGTIEGGNRVGFYADDSQTVLVGGAFTATSNFRANGILIDTDYSKNFHSSASVSAGTISATTPNLILFDIQRERAGPNQLIRDDANNIIINSNTSPPRFTAENSDIIFTSTTSVSFLGQKDVRVKASDVNIIATASNTFNAADDITIQSKAGNVIYSDEDIYPVTASDGEVSMYTNGFGFQNDISFVTGGFAQTWNADGSMQFAGAGGNAGVLIEGSLTDSTVVLTTGDGDINSFSLAGQQYMYYDDDLSNANRGIFIDAVNSMTIATTEARGSIFFQSDDDTIFQAGAQIRHTQYMARLGFFSTAPDHIHSVNANARETCVRVEYCGDFAGGEFTGAISDLNDRVSFLTSTLRELGLIDYKYSYN